VINPVSVTLVALLLAGGYAGYEFVRVEFTKQEAYRVLEETGSTFAGRHGLYRGDAKQREELRRKMEMQLVAIGISDPELETWIDVEADEAKLGVVYTAKYHWPFDVLQPIAREFQVEHALALPARGR
jgi:hypothetical protein